MSSLTRKSLEMEVGISLRANASWCPDGRTVVLSRNLVIVQ